MNWEILLVAKTGVVIACLVVLFTIEWRAPSSPRIQQAESRHRWGRNLSLWGINSLLSPLIVIPLTVFAASFTPAWRPDWSMGSSGLLLDILLLDCWIYWWHRANHSVPFLWRFHRVHHLDQWLDVTSAVRFHFGEVVLSALFRAVFILCMGVPLLSVIVFETVVLLMAGFQHSNVRVPARLESSLSRFLITPAIHWVHHHVQKVDTDSNYGTLFSFWDRVFGSLSPNKRTPEMAVGLDTESDLGLGELLVLPFRPISLRQAD